MNSNCSETIFVGDSEMAMLMRSLDWSQTLLGSVSDWKSSLKTAVSICLNSRFPMVIWWGKDLVLLYNDAWQPILGTKHPKALGTPGREVWSEIWDIIGVQLHSVLETAKATWSDDMLLLVDRYGYTEEAYFTYSYSPIFLETGEVGGAFTAVTETTRRVVGERRLSTLRELAANTVEAKSVEETCRIACDTLASNPYDIPFALLYLIEPDGKQAQLVQTVRVDAGTPSSPEQVDLTQAQDCWQLTQVKKTGEAEIVYELTTRFGVLPGGAWNEPSRAAIALPIAQAGQKEQLAGFLVLGISPRREFDDEYRGFFDLVASNVATAIANAQAYEAERKRAEALAELDRAKTTFFSNISHEFRTPLTLMMSPLEELSNTLAGRLQPDEQEQLQLVQRNSLRLQKLVNTLLDFSRIEAGRMQASYEPTDLATYTAELASVFRSLIERAGMKLVIDCPPLPEQVYVDREMWEKIILNLLSNAFKFTFAGSITVRLKPVGNAVELTVADTGVGIPATELPRLFERFHRVSGTRSRTYEGSGIGLALVQELVKLHGGSIRVTSKVNGGTTFAIVIPCGSAHLPNDQIQATRILTSTALGADSYIVEASRWIAEEGNREQGTGNRGKDGEDEERGEKLPSHTSHTSHTPHILLVEDNADMRAYIKRLLSQYWDVETVSNGLAALEAIAQRLPDLVLSDVMMPELDGFGLLRELRTNPHTKEIPVILLSARAGEESRIEGLQAGADDYLIKPFSARELLARVETTLKLAQLRRQAARESKRAEEALRQSEEKLRLAVTSARMVAWNWNASTNQIVRSETACDILGLSPETVNGSSSEAWNLVHPEDRTLHQAKVAEAIAHHTNYISEFRIIRPDNGAVIWVQERGQMRFDEQGNILGVEGILFDISDRKQAEEALRQSEEQLRLAAEAANLGLWHWDVQSDTLNWTDRCKALFGLPADTEMSYQVFLNALHPEDRQGIQEMRPVLKDGQLGRHEHEYRTVWPDGTVRWLMARGNAIYDTDGKPTSSMGVIFDITDRKQAEIAIQEGEERLKLAVEVGRMVAWEWNPLDKIIITSANLPEIYGVTAIQGIEQGFALLHPEDRSRHQGMVEQAVETRSGYHSEFRIIRPDTGAIIWLEERGQALLNEDGSLQKLISVAIDITARKQAEAARAAAEQRYRIVSDLIPFGMWETDTQGNATYLSQLFLDMTGQTLEEHRQSWQTLLYPDDTQSTIAAWNECVRSGGLWEHEFRIRGKDGQYRTILARGLPVRNSTGEITAYVGANYDITDRKKATEALQRSEAAFRTISNAAPAFVWVSSPNGVIKFFNDRWYEFTGQTEAEALGFGWIEVLHPEDAARILPYWEHCRQTGETYEGEVRYRRHDGEYCWHAFRALPHRSANGEIEAWYGLSVDISDRKRSEATLRESERRFRRLVESNMFGVAFGDFTGGIHYVNDYFLNMVGYTWDEIAAEHVQWTDITPPEFLPLDEQAMVELRTNGVATPFEKEYIRKDGTRVPILIGSALLDEPYDQQQEIIAFYVDLTERKQTENALRQALQKLNFHVENTPMAVIEWDGELRATRWSGAAEGIFGWQADEVLGRLLTDLRMVFEEDIEQVTEVSRRLTIGEESYVFSYNRNYTKGGDVIHCEWYNSSLRDQSGRTISILSLVLDVTERVRYERDRERMLQQEQAARESAETANRIKDEFLAVVSHELRSPLNPILGWSRLLRSGKLNEQKTEQALEVIERNAQMQAQLINDLLDVSRILRGKLSLDTKPVDLVFTIQAAMETVRLAAEAKCIQIYTQFTPDVGYVAGDPGRLQQVVWNLLSNAVKFTSEGGRVDIRLERIDTQAQITVRDTGKGIPADFLPYVFEQFRQENSATTRRFGGLGLGLAIVRYLVELHGGTVQADSPGEGQGATFTVKLPLMPHQPTKNQDPKPFEPALNLHGTRILIVDDDDSTREFIAFLLDLHGANVIATATATEAITTLTQFQPDVLLSDIGMPDVDGYMLMRQVRALPPQQGGMVPAIALTAYAGEIDYRQAMAAGFQRHIPKPVEPQLLIQAIAELIPIRNS